MMTRPRSSKAAPNRTRQFKLAAAAFLFVGLAAPAWPVIASPEIETFGPGTVDCQTLAATQTDCLLAASRITQGNRNVATFSLESLPRGEQTLFIKWCLATTDGCVVTVTGRREAPESTRLSTVTSVHWTRLSAPVNDAAARALE